MIKHTVTIWSKCSTPRCIPERSENICPRKNLYCTQIFQFSSVQSLSLIWLFATPWTAAHQAFREALFVIAKRCTQPKCPSIHEWINKCDISIQRNIQFSSVQLLNRVRLFATPWITARQAYLSITNSRSSLRLTSIESVMPSSHLILCHPLLLLPTIPPSIRVFTNESTLHMMWAKYWTFSFSISPSNEHPGLISFRMDWLDFLAVQGTLKSLLQHHSSKTSILRCSAFFTVQLSHPYVTTGKT